MFVPCPENEYRPSFLATNWFYLAIGFLVLLKVISMIMLQGYSGASIFNEISRQDIYALVNDARIDNGLDPLTVSSKLEYAAELKLADIKANGYFDHVSPAGKTPWTWIEQSNYSYTLAGENLAMNFLSSKEAFDAWMNSPSHRRNILMNDFKETGISSGKAVINGNETVVIVQMFGKPKTVNPIVAGIVPSASALENPTPTPKVTSSPTKASSAIPKSTPKPSPVKVPPTITPTPSPTLIAKENPIIPLKIEDPKEENLISPATIDDTLYATDNTIKSLMKWIFYASLLILVLKLSVAIKQQFPSLILKGAVLVILAYALGIGNWVDLIRGDRVLIGQEAALVENR